MRALAASPLGFLIGVSLGALGGGGSILAVPVLVYAAGLDPRQATTVSLILVGAAALVGVLGHRRAGRVRVRIGIAFGAAGIAGSLAGTTINQRLNPDVLLLGFSVLIAVAAWRMLTACPSCTRVGEQRELAASTPHSPTTVEHLGPRKIMQLVAAGTAVGFLTGLFGVGGGFIIVPALTLLLGFNMPNAIGTSLLIIAINSGVALAPRLPTTEINWTIALPFVASAIAGVLTGSRIADKLHPEKSLRAFAGLLVAVALFTATQATLALT